MEQCTNQVIGNRHSRVKKRGAEDVEKGGTETGEDNPVHVVNASVSPQAAVKPEPSENKNAEDGIPRSESYPRR